MFGFLLLLTLVLGAFSAASLTYFDHVSSQLQERWLPTTRALGDLGNFTSDFPAAEEAALLGSTEAALQSRIQQMRGLDATIAAIQLRYVGLPHDPQEAQLYADFSAGWRRYRQSVDQVVALLASNERAAALQQFETVSKAAYTAANDSLDELNRQVVLRTQAASRQASLAYQRSFWLIVAAMLIGVGTVAGAMLYVQRFIARPLQRMSGRMKRLAQNETDIDTEGDHRPDEIGEMARSVLVFRDNAVELASGRRGLEQQASMLEEKLTEERRLTALQRNFVSMASHELRTPLTLIDGYAQRLIRRGERMLPAEVADCAGRIRTAVLRITHSIGNLIDAARVADGEVDLYFHPEPVNVIDVLRRVCKLHRELASRVPIQEEFGDITHLPVWGDEELLGQVFSNVLSNAIKYSTDLVPIRVRVEAGGAWMAVQVEDRGIGIPEADRAKIFTRYMRGTNTGGIVGSGIGLFFAKTAVDLHRGEIAVTSEERVGTTVTVRLPLWSETGS